MFDFPLNSRVHPLLSLGDSWFVKRDDELSCSISGSKVRKYTSLVPWILSQDTSHVSLVGGYNSNNVLGLTQLLIERGVHPHAYVRKSYGGTNALLLNQLLGDDNIHILSRDAWPPSHLPGLVIPEGAFIEASLPGAITLGEELKKDEFHHVFIEAGTGLQAIALILSGLKAHVHVLLLADSENVFERKLLSFKRDIKTPYSLYHPSTAKSFGSVNATIENYVEEFPRKHGFFVEPIYSGKLFYEAEKIGSSLSGKKCIIHSGGLFSTCSIG